MGSVYKRSEALVAATRELARAGDGPAAYLIAGSIEESDKRAEALIAAAEALAKAGRTGQASDALTDAFTQTTRGQRGPVLTTLGDAAGVLAAIAGVETLREVAEAVLEVESWWGRSE